MTTNVFILFMHEIRESWWIVTRDAHAYIPSHGLHTISPTFSNLRGLDQHALRSLEYLCTTHKRPVQVYLYRSTELLALKQG